MEKPIIINKLSGHDKEAKVGKCSVKPGDKVTAGDVLLTLESGKGSLSVKAEYNGKIISLDISDGDTVKKGQVIGIIEASGEGSNSQPKSAYSFGITKPIDKEMEFDLVIIGGGPGGYVAAVRAAQAGLTTALIESDRLGGTCLNYGCMPTKAMVSSVSLIEGIKEAHGHGISTGDITVDFSKLMERKNQVVDQLVGGIEHLMEAHAIEYINGKAEVAEDGLIHVNTKKFSYKLKYKNLILAMGSRPASLPIKGADHPDILTSTEMLALDSVPESLVIIGGGVIGMEFAFIYRALGAEVSVVEFAPQILPVLDPDVVEVIRDSALEKGIKIYEGAMAKAITDTLDASKLLEVEIDGETTHICVEKIAMAVGRKANLDSLDLSKLGVELVEKKNGIKVDACMRTNIEGIYAIGDVTNIMQLAHVASHQGIVAVDNIVGNESKMDYSAVPSAVFTVPEVGNVGLGEKEATLQGKEIIISKFPFMANGKAIAMGESDGFVKLIADKETKTILGGSVVGPHATDLLAVIGNLVALKVDITEAQKVIYAHPTTAESVNEAILMLEGKGIHFA